MILGFRDHATRDIYNGENTKAARSIPMSIWNISFRKLDLLNAARQLHDLRIPPGNRLEMLRGDWMGFHSIRVNDQYRVVFVWVDGNVKDVQIVDYH
jgi:proteic killer suppression protein